MNTFVGCATLNQTPLDWEQNKQQIIYAIEYARIEGLSLLCLPELCITGYGCEDLFLAPWVAEKALQVLLELRAYCYDISVSIGLPLCFEGNLYNVACLIEDGVIQGFYAKQHLANDGIHYETRWFTPWPTGRISSIQLDGQILPLGDVVFPWKNTVIGFEICEDAWRTSTRPALGYQNRLVEIILNPSASHFAFGKTKWRHDLVLNSSLQFNCLYLYANLLGNEAGRAIYDGELLIAHKGKLVARNALCSFQAFNLVKVAFDLHSNEIVEYTEPSSFVDKNEEIALAISLALYDYMRKSKSKGFVLSLSGGADSAACAVLVADMIKRGVKELGFSYFVQRSGMNIDLCNINTEQSLTSVFLTCAYQSTQNSSHQTFEAAKLLAESIGAVFYHWKIDQTLGLNLEIIENAIGRSFAWETDDLLLQNIQARVRSPLIWVLANLKNALLLTTSNRSEGDVGYATMDGDTSGSIAPIAGIDKHSIKTWLLYAEKTLGYKGLQLVNQLEPSAELRPLSAQQFDEKDLMPYDLLNQIEIKAIRERKHPQMVLDELSSENRSYTKELLMGFVKKFYNLWSRNQWKRERLAPSFHVDEHNVDPKTWCRFPILNSGFSEELKKLK